MRRVPFLAPNLFILHITTLWILFFFFLTFFNSWQSNYLRYVEQGRFHRFVTKILFLSFFFQEWKKKRVIDPCSRVILVKNLDGGINISTQISWPPQGRRRHYCLQTLQCSRSQKPHSFFSGTHTLLLLLLYHFTFLKRGHFKWETE